MTTDINFPPFLETILLFPFYLWRRICGLEVWWEVDIGHSSRGTHWSLLESYPRLKRGSDVEMSYVVFREIASAFGCPYLIRSNFIKTTYDISLDSWISFLPLGFSPTLTSGLWMFFVRWRSSVGVVNPKEKKEMSLGRLQAVGGFRCLETRNHPSDPWAPAQGTKR